MADNLTAEQTEKILQFQDLTGIEDMTVCRDTLERHNWDLEVSVQDQLNLNEGRPSLFNNQSTRQLSVVDAHGSRDVIYSTHSNSPSRRPEGFSGLFRYVVSFVLNICYNTISNLLNLTLRIIRPDPRRYVTDPVSDVISFIHYFENKYGLSHPVFYQGSYSQALNDAKHELRFLLVYLHCEDHQDTAVFCRETLTNTEVVQYVNSNMIFWACSITTPEGYRVSQALRENGYPFLALIVLHDSRMTVVGRMEGPFPAQELVERLRELVADNEASLVVARADRVKRNFNQTLRQQQDRAYMESLRADQEKERQRWEERERIEEEQQRLREQELAEIRRKDEIRQQKIDFLDRVPEEPSINDPNALQVVFKLPDGSRLERRFHRTQSLEGVYYYVFCHPSSPDSFQIVINFPKRVLDCLGDSSKTLEEVGLRHREVLFVYDLEA